MRELLSALADLVSDATDAIDQGDTVEARHTLRVMRDTLELATA